MMALQTLHQATQAAGAQRHAKLEQALRPLHALYQQVLTLKFSRRLSTHVIAAMLSCSVANVQVLQQQALVELQRLIAYSSLPDAPHGWAR